MKKVLMAVDETAGSKSVLSVYKTVVRERVDLIIMGRNGKTLLQRLVAGSVSKEVERNATVPVLVAKTAGCEKSIAYNLRGREAYAA